MCRPHWLMTAVCVACVSAAVSCATDAQTPSVEFGDSDVLGRWQAVSNKDQADAAAQPVETDTPTGSVAPEVGNVAGSAAIVPPAAVDSGTPQSAADGGVAAPSTDAGATPSDPGVTSLSFQVTTSAAGGRYQPKNIGAIWIEDDAGKVVKTLQVWAGTRRRYLTGYLGAMAGSSIDVTASATLTRHQTHTVSWDLKDRNGGSVSPGTYRVRMELTDGNQAGKSNSVAFDTSQGKTTLSPADAPSFAAMKLELQ